MRTILKVSVLALLSLIICTPANSQRKKDLYPKPGYNEPVILISGSSEGKETIINIFEITEIVGFHEPNAPRFLLMDQKGKFAMGIGGYVRAVGSYDFDGISDNVDFIPAKIPSKDSHSSRERFGIDASTSMLFLKMVGRSDVLGDIVVYTSANFRGNSNSFKLRNAYIQLLGFTFGYDTGMFMDLSACPPTIDYEGPNGMTFYRTAQMRYEGEIAKGLKVGIAVESPSVSGTAAPDVKISTQRAPNIPAYIQYTWNNSGHVRVGGIYRNMSYKNEVSEKFKSINGWGIQGSTTFSFYNFRVYGQYTYGKGIASYFNDLGNFDLDIVPEYGISEGMQALRSSGWYAGLQYNFSKKVFASSTFSNCNLRANKNYSQNNRAGYKDGKYLVANVFWNVSNDFQVGAEYLHGWRKDFNGEKDGANRINICTKYYF